MAQKFSTAELLADDMQEDASGPTTNWGSPIRKSIDAKKPPQPPSQIPSTISPALAAAMALAYKEAETEDDSESEHGDEDDENKESDAEDSGEYEEEEEVIASSASNANGTHVAAPPPKDPKFVELYEKSVAWADSNLDNPAAFKAEIAKAATFDELKQMRDKAAKERKNAREKKRRQEQTLAKEAARKAAEATKTLPGGGGGGGGGAAANYQEELDAVLAKTPAVIAPPPVTPESSKRKRSLTTQTSTPQQPAAAAESPSAKKPKNQPQPPPLAKTASTTTIAPPPPAPAPPLNILKYMFGSRFMSGVAQLLIGSGAKTVLGTLPQVSFLASMANATIELARPDLADEANRVTSKSSSSSDKDAVRTLREFIKTPGHIEAALIASRLLDMSKASAPSYPLIGFAAMCAANVVLNAVLVTNVDKTHLAIAMATSDNNKHEFRVAMNFLAKSGMFGGKPLLDLELADVWRIKTNRYTTLRLSTALGPVLINSDLAQNAPVTREPSVKRARIDETRNTSFPAPESIPSATTTTAPRHVFSMPMTMVGPHGLMHYSSDEAFKYDARALFKSSNSDISLVPNRTMMMLLAMMFDSLNTPEHVTQLFVPLKDQHFRSDHVHTKQLVYAKTNPFASAFLAIADSSVTEKSERFYKDNPSVTRTGHEFIVQSARALFEAYASGTSSDMLSGINQWDGVIAHVLFSFMRMDALLASERIGGVAHHPAARVLTSEKDRTGVHVTLSAGELPVGVSVRVPDLTKRVLLRMWMRFLNRLGLLDSKKKLLAKAPERFLDAYHKADYKDLQWVVDYCFKPGFALTPDQTKTFREALMPVMFALFPPSFMGSVGAQ